MKAFELNFDGLIGPTHNYAGLAAGNLASEKNAKLVSQPKKAALEGLEKMRTLVRLGYRQGFFPPQQRPRIDVLRNLGFDHPEDKTVLAQVAKLQPNLLPKVYSASSMWAANAATVTPSADSADGRVHFTPANLLTTAHRAIEHTETFQSLSTVFADDRYFAVHKALLAHQDYADEGAANHTRLCTTYADKGIGLFVYGRDEQQNLTQRFPARQTKMASQAVARQHGALDRAVFLLQNPKAIDAGAFHNDVVAVGNGPVLFFHQDAFEPASEKRAFDALHKAFAFTPLRVSRDCVSMEDAIRSYLFNSQLLAGPDGDMNNMHVICPMECHENPAVRNYLQSLTHDTSQAIRKLSFVDVRQSMSNGGGPACLRLRVVLNKAQIDAVHPAFLVTEEKIDALQAWVNTCYRDQIAPADLADPSLLDDSYKALDELTQVLGLGSYYEFQRV